MGRRHRRRRRRLRECREIDRRKPVKSPKGRKNVPAPAEFFLAPCIVKVDSI